MAGGSTYGLILCIGTKGSIILILEMERDGSTIHRQSLRRENGMEEDWPRSRMA